jgi:Ca2+-transporting ATPase
MWLGIVYVGVVMAACTLLVLDWALPGGLVPGGTRSLPEARTLAFTTLVFAQLFNVFNARSDRRSAFRGLATNGRLWLAVLLSALLQVAVVHTPVLQRAFGTVPLDLGEWVVCVGVASAVLWLRELSKLAARERAATGAQAAA